MELRYKREAAVGLMLVLGTLTFVFMMMWLRGKSFTKGDVVRVMFDDVAGLKVGDPVRTSGVTVGTVQSIRLESPGMVDVSFDVQKGPPPRVDAGARILSSDLFGARYVEYSPGVARDALPRDSVLRGQRVQDMSEMAAALGVRGRTLLDSLALTTVFVTRELGATLRAMQQLMATLNSGAAGSTEQLQATLNDMRRAMQRVDQLLAQNGPVASEALRGIRDATARADSLTRTLSHASAQFDSILAKVNSGRGPAAALLNDSTVIRDLMSTNAALRELLLDFRANPGRYIRLRL